MRLFYVWLLNYHYIRDGEWLEENLRLKTFTFISEEGTIRFLVSKIVAKPKEVPLYFRGFTDDDQSGLLRWGTQPKNQMKTYLKTYKCSCKINLMNMIYHICESCVSKQWPRQSKDDIIKQTINITVANGHEIIKR
jgi:hypothetical protein